jgi:hypothetical protein
VNCTCLLMKTSNKDAWSYMCCGVSRLSRDLKTTPSQIFSRDFSWFLVISRDFSWFLVISRDLKTTPRRIFSESGRISWRWPKSIQSRVSIQLGVLNRGSCRVGDSVPARAPPTCTCSEHLVKLS